MLSLDFNVSYQRSSFIHQQLSDSKLSSQRRSPVKSAAYSRSIPFLHSRAMQKRLYFDKGILNSSVSYPSHCPFCRLYSFTASLLVNNPSINALSAFPFPLFSSFKSTASTSTGGLSPRPSARFHRFMRGIPIQGCNSEESARSANYFPPFCSKNSVVVTNLVVIHMGAGRVDSRRTDSKGQNASGSSH